MSWNLYATNHILSHIKEVVEKDREAVNPEGDEIGDVTCFELLETLELS